MDSPLIAGALVFIAVYAAGAFFEYWSWSKPLVTIGVIALIAESIALVLR